MSNGSGIHSVSISEHVLGVLLAHTRGLQESIQQQMQHTWNQTAPSYQQLSGQKNVNRRHRANRTTIS